MESGGTLRDHYEQAQKQLGERITALDTPPCPPLLLRAWFWFWDLARKRQVAVGMRAVMQPITYTELEAWSRYTGNRPTYLERRAIDVFDRAFIDVMR